MTCTVEDGRIKTDLHTKETDRNMYLLPSSCHPKQKTKAIPLSLALRVVRVCSSPEDRDKRLVELESRLLARDYPRSMVERALEKARKVPRQRALREVKKQNQTQRSVLAVTFDPRLPAISSSMAKHWRAMVGQDSHLKEWFTEPPLTAYRRQQNIRGHLIRAKLAKRQRVQRSIKGMKKCGSGCTSCPYIKEERNLQINGSKWKLNKPFNYQSYNVIYAIFC